MVAERVAAGVVVVRVEVVRPAEEVAVRWSGGGAPGGGDGRGGGGSGGGRNEDLGRVEGRA